MRRLQIATPSFSKIISSNSTRTHQTLAKYAVASSPMLINTGFMTTMMTTPSTTATTTVLTQQKRFASAGSFFRSKAPSTATSEKQATATATETTEEAAAAGKKNKKKVVTFESAFEKTKVAFASAASVELIPSIAAAEAYDLALTALRASTGDETLNPNFCFTVISADHENMIDAPQVVWRSFSSTTGNNNTTTDENSSESIQKKNPITNPEEVEKMKNRLMIGSMVRNQRVGDGFIEVMLGVIPDLRYTSFTFDQTPKNLEEYRELLNQQGIQGGAVRKSKNTTFDDIPTCVTGFTFSDWRIGGKHPFALAHRIEMTNQLMMNFNKMKNSKNTTSISNACPPLVGAVLPPSESVHSFMRRQQEKLREVDEKAELTSEEPTLEQIQQSEAEIESSLFFVNDDVYKGSAGAILLHSDLIDAHVSTLMPPVIVQDKVTIDEAQLNEAVGEWHIKKLGGKPACDFIRQVYENDDGLKKNKNAKLFLGLHHPKLSDQPFPLSFIGRPDQGDLVIVLPAFLRDAAIAAKHFTLVRDDELFESRLIGQDLIQFERSNLVQKEDNDTDNNDEDATSTSFAMHKDETKNTNFCCTNERVRVHREKNSRIVVANAAGIHFSHPELYTIFKRAEGGDGMIKFGGGNIEKHAPSIVRRVLGEKLPNTGLHASGIVIPFGDEEIPPQVLPRASTHLMFTAKKDDSGENK